jgi:hypothetical protein
MPPAYSHFHSAHAHRDHHHNQKHCGCTFGFTPNGTSHFSLFFFFADSKIEISLLPSLLLMILMMPNNRTTRNEMTHETTR